jgi:hypothetical protein
VGLYGLYWGIKGGNLNTTSELEYSGSLYFASIMWFLILAFFAGWALWVMRKPTDKCRVRTLVVSLYFWALLFIGIAIMVPKNTSSGIDYINDSCTNTTSYLKLVDTAYTTANSNLCQPGICTCNADSSLWDEDSSAATNLISLDSVTDSVADSTTDAANTVTATTSEYGMVDSDIWADNFQDCPVSQVVMNEVTYNMGNATENAKFGLDAMGAVELDFTCAGMC